MKKNFWLSAASVAMLSLPWLGFTGLLLLGAFVPLLIVRENLQGQTGRKGKPRRFVFYPMTVFGLWAAIDTWWIGKAMAVDPVVAAAPFASAAITSLLGTAAFMLYNRVAKRASRALACTVLVTAWIALEYLYLAGDISFPWLTLGNGLANDVKLVQWYEYTGIFGGSLWVLVSNLALFELYRKIRNGRKFVRQAVAADVVVFLPMALSLAIYFCYKEPARPVTVHIVQPNIDPVNEKFSDMSQADQQDILLSLASRAPADVDFIVAPETALDDYIWENQLAENSSYVRFRQFMAENYPQAAFIIGASTMKLYPAGVTPTPTARRHMENSFRDHYNTALQIDSSGVPQIYHKEKLVVGAEMFPYPKFFGSLGNLMMLDLGGMSGNLGRDNTRLTFTSPEGVKTSTAICFESIYGQFCSRFVQDGAQLLFIITNDGWWGNTAGHRNHFSFARLRAIELRRSIARSANTGISGIIDQRGDVVKKEGWGRRTAITGAVNLNDRITFYARYGDWVARISVYVLALSLLYYVAYRRRKKDRLV